MQYGERWLLRIGKGVLEGYLSRKRRSTGAEARLAEAMVRYARLCISTGKTPHDRAEAAAYLNEAASLYTEIGQPENAAEALALMSEAEVDAPGG